MTANIVKEEHRCDECGRLLNPKLDFGILCSSCKQQIEGDQK